jgi:hypothetical protein
MDPSPIIYKFIHRDVISSYTVRQFNQESKLVDSLCLFSAIGSYFRAGASVLKERSGSLNARMALSVEQFREECKDAFIGLYVDRVNGLRVVEAVPPSVVDSMAVLGRMCDCKLVYPFAVKLKDAGFIVSVVQGFQPVFERLFPLWRVEGDPRQMTIALGAVLNRLMAEWSESELQRKALATLLVEFVAVSSFAQDMHSFVRDPRTLRATNPVVRELFWKIAFLNWQINPQWDSMDSAVGVFALEAYVTSFNPVDIRASFVKMAVSAMERVAAVDAHLEKLDHLMRERDSEVDLGLMRLTRKKLQSGVLSRFDADDFELRAAAYMVGVFMEQIETLAEPSSSARQDEGAQRRVDVPAQSVRDVVRNAQNRAAVANIIDGDLFAAPAVSVPVVGLEILTDDVLESDDEVVETIVVAEDKKKKLTQSQRRKAAKKREEEDRNQQCSALLDALCFQVANQVAAEQVRVEAQTLLATQEFVELLVQEVAAELANELANATLKEVRIDEGQKAQGLVLQQLKDGTLPMAFKREILFRMAPWFHKFISSNEDEDEFSCFMCLSDIDLFQGELTARYLLCCNGSFICGECIRQGSHARAFQHDMVAELSPVQQARAVRSEFGFRV